MKSLLRRMVAACFSVCLAWTAVSVRAQSPATVQPARMTTNSPIEELSAAIESTNSTQRFQAFDAIGQLGANGKAAVPALLKAMNDPRKREMAITALMHLGPAAVDAIPQLIDAMAARPILQTNNGQRVQNSRLGDSWPAANALANIGPAAVPALLDAVKGQDERTRIWAAAALIKGTEGTNSPHMDILVGELRFGSDLYRRDAVHAAGLLGPLAAPLVPDLAALAPVPAPGFDQSEVLDSLRRIGPGAASAIPVIVPLLDSNDRMVKNRALEALNGIASTPPKSAVPLLIKLLTYSDPNKSLDYPVHSDAAEALGRLGPDAKEALPTLIPMMNDPDTRVAGSAVAAIAQINPSAPEAVTNALNMMTRQNMRNFLIGSPEQLLMKTEPKNIEIIRAFITFAENNAASIEPRTVAPEDGFSFRPPSRIGPVCESFFHKLGPEQAYALPDLREFAKDSHPVLQKMATNAIAAIQKKP